MRPLLVALAAVALLAGCGGGARRTATAPPKPGPTPSVRLQRYYSAMSGRQRRFDAIGDRVVRIVEDVDPARPGAHWDAAARRLGGVTADLQTLGADLARVRPPADVADAHRLLAESTIAFGDWVFGLQQALQSHRPSLLAVAVAGDTTAIRQARAGWRKAVLRYSAKLGVTPPEWLVPSPPA